MSVENLDNRSEHYDIKNVDAASSTFQKWTQNKQSISDLESMTSKTRKLKLMEKSKKVESLDQLAVSIEHCVHLLSHGNLNDSEFVAAYILLFLQQRHDPWFSGIRKQSIPVCSCSYPTSIPLNQHINNQTTYQNNNEELSLLKGAISLSDKERSKLISLWKKNKIQDPISLITIFQYCLLHSVPVHVHESIVNWGYGKRPYRMMFELPSAREVLELQCTGRRCLTVFVKKDELGLLLKDPYPPFESRDVLSFLFHDMQHMEKFVDPKYYCEQIGILKQFKLWVNDGIFEPYDAHFTEDWNHAISDMNACCIHSLGFLKSKWKQAHWRFLHHCTDLKESETATFTQEEENSFDELFDKVLQKGNVPEKIRSAMHFMCQTTRLTRTDADTIREYYHYYGRDHIGLPFELLP